MIEREEERDGGRVKKLGGLGTNERTETICLMIGHVRGGEGGRDIFGT